MTHIALGSLFSQLIRCQQVGPVTIFDEPLSLRLGQIYAVVKISHPEDVVVALQRTTL